MTFSPLCIITSHAQLLHSAGMKMRPGEEIEQKEGEGEKEREVSNWASSAKAEAPQSKDPI